MTYTDAVRRQTELTQKVLAGSATDADRAELTGLAERLTKATAVTGDARAVKREMTVVTAEEFEKHLADEQAALAKAPDVDRLALLHENVAAVQAQVAKGAAAFVVWLPVVEKLDPMAAIMARLDDMEKKFDQRFRTGVGEPRATATPEPKPEPTPEPAPAPEPAPEPAAKQSALAKESVDEFFTLRSVDDLIAFVTALTEKMASDDTSDDVQKILDGAHDPAYLAGCASTLAQKAADLVEAAQQLDKAKATRLAKPPFPPSAEDEKPATAPEDALTEDEDAEDDMKGGKKPKDMKATKDDDDATEPTAKGDHEWGPDLAPPRLDADERFRELRHASARRG